eukprot:6200780-Pleurochrysis_carterae.AAC.11
MMLMRCEKNTQNIKGPEGHAILLMQFHAARRVSLDGTCPSPHVVLNDNDHSALVLVPSDPVPVRD